MIADRTHGAGSDCEPSDWAPSSRQTVVNESAGDERLVTVAVIVAVVVVVAMVDMVVTFLEWRRGIVAAGFFNKI